MNSADAEAAMGAEAIIVGAVFVGAILLVALVGALVEILRRLKEKWRS